MAGQHDTAATASPDARLESTSSSHDIFISAATVASWHHDGLLTNATLKIQYSASEKTALFQLHVRMTLKSTPSVKTSFYVLVQPQDIQLVKDEPSSQLGQREALSMALDKLGPRLIRLHLTLSRPPIVVAPLHQDLACKSATAGRIRDALRALSRQSDFMLSIAHNTLHQEQLNMLCADLGSRSIMSVADDRYIAKLYHGKGGQVIFGPADTTLASDHDDEAVVEAAAEAMVEAVAEAEPDANDGIVSSEMLPSPPSYERALSLPPVPPVALPDYIERPLKRQRRSSADSTSERSSLRLVMTSCRQMLEEQQQAFARQLAEQQQVISNLQQSFSELQQAFLEHQAQHSSQPRPDSRDQIKQVASRVYAKLAPRFVQQDELAALEESLLEATAEFLDDQTHSIDFLVRHQILDNRQTFEEFVSKELENEERRILEHLESATFKLQFPNQHAKDG
jgi:hypothetical protein